MKKTAIKLALVLVLAVAGLVPLAAPAAAAVPICDIEFCSASQYCKCQWGSNLYICHIWMDLLYLD